MTRDRAGLWLQRLMVATFVLLAAIIDPAAEEERMLVTVEKPATVPIVQSLAADALKEGPRHVVVTVTGFQPSPAGPVQAIVEAHCGATLVEIGRFGLLPQTPFSAAEPRKAQRFSFNLAGPTCDGLDSVSIRLVPAHGDGHGASLEIGSAELR